MIHVYGSAENKYIIIILIVTNAGGDLVVNVENWDILVFSRFTRDTQLLIGTIPDKRGRLVTCNDGTCFRKSPHTLVLKTECTLSSI